MMHNPRRIRKDKGLSLVEVLVVTGVMAVVSLATMILYTSAQGSFEHASSKTSMNGYARGAVDRVTGILATASAKRPPGNPAEALYWPDPADSLNEHTYVDFLSMQPFIRQTPTEATYAFDNGATPPGYTSVFRYRLAWTGTQLGNIEPNSLYLERLLPDPLESTPMPNLYRQVVARNVHRCTFRRSLTGSLQLRVIVYAYDPVSGDPLDGTISRTQTKRRRRDATSTATRDDVKSYEILTAIPLPTLNIR